MTRTFFLHVGPAKTGTSALQKVMCSQSFENLYYPQTGRWHDGAHHRLILSLAGHKSFQGQTLISRDDSVAALKAEVALNNKDVLVSSEAIGNLAFIQESLGPWIDETFDKMVVVVTMRHPIARAASSYNQAVKDANVGLALSPEEYLHDRPSLCLLSTTITAISNHGHDLICVPYEPVDTFVPRFLKSIGHEAEVEIATNINRSMSGAALTAVLATNRVFSDPTSRQTVFKALLEEEPVPVWQGTAFPFTRDVIAWYEETHIAADREKMLALGYDYPDPVDKDVFQLNRNERENLSNFLQQQITAVKGPTAYNANTAAIVEETLDLFSGMPAPQQMRSY